MSKFIIEGGKKLKGEVEISGSKNAALPLLTASILTDGEVVLHNIPDLSDIRVLIELLEKLGKNITFEKGTVSIKGGDKISTEAPYDLVNKMRASIIVLGPLLAKYNKARVSLPGGCAFGPRPIDLHLKGLEKLGAKITFDHGYVDADTKGLKGNSMVLLGKFGSSVLGTDNIMMAATLAEGETVIQGAACEPECTDLAQMLVKMGADIKGIGTSTLKIRGVGRLNGTEYKVIPDRIETGTFISTALATGGEVNITNCNPWHVQKPLEILKESGAEIHTEDNKIYLESSENLRSFSIKTRPYPGFPTDLQAIFAVLACRAKGSSSLTEGIYPDRFGYVPELIRMGAKIEREESTIVVCGGDRLNGTDVKALDLRAGASLVIAGLIAEGNTYVHNIEHIDRGYEGFEKKLRGLGAEIRRE